MASAGSRLMPHILIGQPAYLLQAAVVTLALSSICAVMAALLGIIARWHKVWRVGQPEPSL